MGIQKYRADVQGAPFENGGIPYHTQWVGGPSLALIRNCPTEYGPRTVYVTGEPCTFSSLPAAASVKGKTVRGFLIHKDGQGFTFSAPKRLNLQVKMPSVRDVAHALRLVRDDIQPDEKQPDDDTAFRDVRLQVLEDGRWSIHSGPSDYDLNHKGFWGASSVAYRQSLKSLREVAKDLLEQAQDAVAQSAD